MIVTDTHTPLHVHIQKGDWTEIHHVVHPIMVVLFMWLN